MLGAESRGAVHNERCKQFLFFSLNARNDGIIGRNAPACYWLQMSEYSMNDKGQR